MTILSRIIAVLLLIGLLACQQQEERQPLPPLLEVGSRYLTLQQFNRELLATYPDLSVLPDEEQLLLKEQLLKQLIDRELILGEACRLDVQLTPDELDSAMREVRGSYSAAEFSKILKQAGSTEEGWLEALKLRLLTTKVSSAALPNIEVSDTEMEKYYLAHKEKFRRPVEIRARQMLFKSREDAVKVKQMLASGGDFATLARQYSESPDRENGGSLGYFSAGVLPIEFDQVLFSLPVQRVSDPVKSPYGYHLFVVERKRRAGLRPYVAVKDEIRTKLYQQKEETAFHQWLEGLQQSTHTKIHRELL